MENRSKPLLSRKKFIRRALAHFFVASGMVFIALAIGVLGYHFIGGLGWVDAFLNASMILGGMGPVNPLTTDAAKIFAAFYALFSGLAFVGFTAVMLAPFLHRLMHKFHWDESANK